MWRQTSKLARNQPRSVAARLEGVPRQQHQLMAATRSEVQLRESRRVFLLSLQDIVASFPKLTNEVKYTAAPISIPEKHSPRRVFDTSPVVTVSESSREESTESDSAPLVDSQTNREAESKTNKSHEENLRNAIRNQNASEAVGLFDQALKNKYDLSPRIAVQLFYLLVESDPISAYSVLKKFSACETRRIRGFRQYEFKMYLKLCSTVGGIEPGYRQRLDVKTFVTDLIEDLLAMDRHAKQELLPKIITGLASQRNVRVGTHAKDLYLYMINNEYEIRPGWLKQLLNLSKYNRQDDLPYDDIMERLAESDTLPHPLPVISAVHNMFPFTESDKMCRTLRALLKFQDRNVIENFPMYSRPDEIYIDMDCLESISSGAAQTGSIEMILLVWDILMQCNYEPTESIYENTVIAFASGGGHLESAFGAIITMKESGCEVPRSLLRSFSLALRPDKEVLDAGMQLLASTPELQTLETFNAMMSCYAERGDTYDVLALLDNLLLKGISPDCNSYSFAIEALGKNIHRWKKHHNPGLVQENMELADRILGMMETNQICPSTDFIRNYVELLCIAGESKTADLVVDDMLEKFPKSVCSKALYRLAITNTENGDFERARELASRITDDIPTLMTKIRSREQRVYHVNRTARAAWTTAGDDDNFDALK